MITLGLAEALRKEHEERMLTYETFDSLGLVAAPTAAGVSVTQATANTVTAYWDGVCVIAGDVGVMNRHLYRKVGAGDDRERADGDPIQKLLQQPNLQEPTSGPTEMGFWETLVAHAVSWGNGFAEIEFDNALRPIGLHNITPDRVQVMVETITDRRGRKTSRVYYLVDGSTRLESDEMLHVAGLGFDGIQGYSPVALFRQSLGLTIATERFGAAFFGNGGWPGIALQMDGKIAPATLERLKSDFAALHGGSDRAHRPIVLDGGLKVSKPITIPPDDAQFLQTRAFQTEEVARILHLPPHKIKHKVNERPGGNFEASELDYTVTTLLPWTKRIEQECNRKLLSAARRGTYYIEHNYQDRLKTDTTTRMASYKTLSDLKVITPELIAQKENLPKPPAPKEDQPPPPTDMPPGMPQMNGARVAAAARAALAAVLQRYRSRECEKARRAAKKGPGALGEWVEAFYGEGEAAVLRESLEPALELVLAAGGSKGDARGVALGFAGRYLERSKAELLGLKANDIEAAVPALLHRWNGARATEAVEELMAAMSAAEVNHVA